MAYVKEDENIYLFIYSFASALPLDFRQALFLYASLYHFQTSPTY